MGKKGRDQNKQQNHKLLVPGAMPRADCHCHRAVGTVGGPCSGVQGAEPKDASPGCAGLGRAVLFVQRLRLLSSGSAFFSPAAIV